MSVDHIKSYFRLSVSLVEHLYSSWVRRMDIFAIHIILLVICSICKNPWDVIDSHQHLILLFNNGRNSFPILKIQFQIIYHSSDPVYLTYPGLLSSATTSSPSVWPLNHSWRMKFNLLPFIDKSTFLDDTFFCTYEDLFFLLLVISYPYPELCNNHIPTQS